MPEHQKTVTRASRSAPLRLREAPSTVDEAGRSVEFVAATERAVDVWDWELWEEVPEVLLMSGVRLPENGQIPLMDSHDYSRVGNVLGSFRGFRVEGAELVGRAVFSATDEGEKAFVKDKEGHLTDVSVGYRVNNYLRLDDGETSTVQGRDFAGPLRVVTDWQPFEVSLCLIGADRAAKARKFIKEDDMAKKDDGKRTALTGKRADAVCDYLEASDGRCTLTGGPVCTWLTSEGVCGKPAGEPRDPDPQDEGTEGGDAPDLAGEDLPVAAPESAPESGTEEGRAAALKERRRIAELTTLCRGHTMPVDKPAPGAVEMRSMSMREMARDFLAHSGQSLGGDIKTLIDRALTTTDLPKALTETARKVLEDAFERADYT